MVQRVQWNERWEEIVFFRVKLQAIIQHKPGNDGNVYQSDNKHFVFCEGFE